MKCPFCGYTESKVIDTRPTDEGERIRRRRECLQCGKRFTSYEVVETTPVMVIKKDGSREAFSHDKLLRGVLKSCEKRPVTLAQLESMVSEIEVELQNRMDREVPSAVIGELVMEKLKKIDLFRDEFNLFVKRRRKRYYVSSYVSRKYRCVFVAAFPIRRRNVVKTRVSSSKSSGDLLSKISLINILHNGIGS